MKARGYLSLLGFFTFLFAPFFSIFSKGYLEALLKNWVDNIFKSCNICYIAMVGHLVCQKVNQVGLLLRLTLL